jgi:LacI family transcriptional regulator
MSSKQKSSTSIPIAPIGKSGTRPVMSDLAKAAGVSIATVSLALAGRPKVSAATREKILKVAAEMGYQKNPYVAALMVSRRRRSTPDQQPVIAFLTFHETAEAWREGLSIDYYTPAAREAGRLGYRLETFWAMDPQMPPKRLAKILYSRGINGILLNSPPRRRIRLEMDFSPFSAVALGAGLQYPLLHRVASDHFYIAREAIKRCADKGLKRVGFVCRQESDDRLQNRWLGAYLAECHRLKMAMDIPPFMNNDYSVQDVVNWIRENRLDGVIGTLRGEWMELFSKAGLKIPQEVRYIGMTLQREDPRISGYVESIDLVARTAVQHLIAMMHRHETGLPDTLCGSFILGRWHEGKSF